MITHNVYMTYANGSDIQIKDRFVWRGKYLRIEQIVNYAEADAALVFMCTEGVTT